MSVLTYIKNTYLIHSYIKSLTSSGDTSNVQGGEYEPLVSLMFAVETQSSSALHFLIVFSSITSSSAYADFGISEDRIAPDVVVRNDVRDTSFFSTFAFNCLHLL